MCECGELVQYGSWAGAVLYEPSRGASLPRLSASVYCTSPRAVRASKGFALLCTVRAPGALRGASLQRLLCLCVPYERQELCAVRAFKGFVPLCAVRASRDLCGASLQRLSTVYERQKLGAVRASKGFVPLCAVRASRAMCGASLQRLSTVCWCSPLKICYVLVYKNLYICTVCTSSHDICCSVREPVCLNVAERSIHVD